MLKMPKHVRCIVVLDMMTAEMWRWLEWQLNRSSNVVLRSTCVYCLRCNLAQRCVCVCVCGWPMVGGVIDQCWYRSASEAGRLHWGLSAVWLMIRASVSFSPSAASASISAGPVTVTYALRSDPTGCLSLTWCHQLWNWCTESVLCSHRRPCGSCPTSQQETSSRFRQSLMPI